MEIRVSEYVREKKKESQRSCMNRLQFFLYANIEKVLFLYITYACTGFVNPGWVQADMPKFVSNYKKALGQQMGLVLRKIVNFKV